MNTVEKIFAYIVFLGLTLSTNESIQNFNVMTLLFIIFVWPFAYCLWNMLFHRMPAMEIFSTYFNELKNEFLFVINIVKKLFGGIFYIIRKITHKNDIKNPDEKNK